MKIKISWIDILVVASTALLIFMLLTRIFGHSATDFTLLVTVILTVAGWMIKSESKFSTLNRELGELKTSFGEFKNQTQERFNSLDAKLEKLISKEKK